MAVNKTINKRTNTHGAMRNCIEYVLRQDKTSELLTYVTGPYRHDEIDYDLVYRTFLEEKKMWNKDTGRMYAHNIISWHKDEQITPEQAFEFGKEFAEKWFSGFQTLVAVHKDKNHIHCHLVTNSVSYEDGRKLHNTKKDLECMKQLTNQMCRERGLTKYDKVDANVDTIASQLENHQVQLLKDVSMFNHLYDMNTQYFKELTMYIIAGEQKLKEVREGELEELKKKAAETGDAMDAQRANDLAANCDRFEKKLHDLKLTRQVALQMAPQIRLLQNNDSLLVERIQSTLSNTLPLWKSQIVIALGMHRSQEALKAQTAVTNMTNELLRKNAEALKTGTIQTAQEAERGIIDLETLKQTNQSLMDTINEVMKIQEEGRTKRLEAEKEMVAMEADLKKKLLELH